MDLLPWMGAVRMRVKTANKNITNNKVYKNIILSESREKFAQIKHNLLLDSTVQNNFNKTLITGLTGVMWIICGLFSWRLWNEWCLILTAPIHCKGFNFSFLQICSNEETNFQLSYFQQIFISFKHFWVFFITFSLPLQDSALNKRTSATATTQSR